MTNTNPIEITKKTARLARLAVTEAEVEAIAPKLKAILGLFEQLQSLDTDGVEPLANVVGEDTPLRDDEETDGGIAPVVLSNAPDEVQGFYGVPKVVE